jgi:hypothetical protein
MHSTRVMLPALNGGATDRTVNDAFIALNPRDAPVTHFKCWRRSEPTDDGPA